MGMVVVWTIVTAIIGLSNLPDPAIEGLVGYVVNFNLVFFYGAPLSTIYTVVTVGDSSTIHVPTMTTNTLNGSFWTAYGIAVSDPFIYVPNGMGTILGAIQVLLLVLIPRGTTKKKDDGNDHNNNNNTGTSNGGPSNSDDDHDNP
jgi:solute carrier family 50 protein (sugar transporter)